ncbi:MAG: hypothetical protein IPO21_07260 [Bacteroidales bacterium]|nr:hypothetical protein [Bacteroidales bacterium]
MEITIKLRTEEELKIDTIRNFSRNNIFFFDEILNASINKITAEYHQMKHMEQDMLAKDDEEERELIRSDIHDIECQLYSKKQTVYEMKIMFLFKEIETCIVSIFNEAYYDFDITKTHKESYISNFWKNKKLNIGDINGYCEYLELRKVSNYIKHENISFFHESQNHILNVKEFKNFKNTYLRNVEYSDSLKFFYNRVSVKMTSFLNEFGEIIIKNAFVKKEENN